MTANRDTIWICSVCGYVHEGAEPPEECPQCGASSDQFEKETAPQKQEEKSSDPLEDYLAQWARDKDDFEKKYSGIKERAKTGKCSYSPMRTQKIFPDWETILFKGAQLYRFPLNEDEPVSTKTVIGAGAKHPLEIDLPVYVSHMSFGALSREAKIALAKGSKQVGTAMCSGEGGMLPDERKEADKYIYELGTAAFSHKDDVIRQADAVEIKIGQAVKPGMGGYLPAKKVTGEIAEIRGIAKGEGSNSPGRHEGISSREDLLREVERIRKLTDGKPVGIKIAAGHIEKDLEEALYARPDFITIDCRGGATGAAPDYIKDNVCMPPIFALHRARKYLDKVKSKVTLCVTGGFRDSADIAKALALGADAVALATASLIAIGCQQYRQCHTDNCPVGVTTQDQKLRKRLNIKKSVEQFVNFYSATRTELENFARISGKDNVHDLDLSDVFTISHEVSQNTDIEHV